VTTSTPLSHAQQRLLHAEMLSPGAADHVVVRAYRLAGPLDVESLRLAFADVVRRHATLRTVYGWDDDGSPGQTVVDPGMVLDTVPLTREPAVPWSAWWDQPFDLEQRPPVRARLQVGPGRSVLCLAVHHIAFDGWSARIVERELGAAYAARREGRPPAWPTIGDYRSYVARERRELTRWRERDLPFWAALLGDAPPPEVPTQTSTSEVRRGEHTRQIDARAVRAFTVRRRQLGATALAVLVLGVARGLGRVHRTRRLSLGTLCAGRIDRQDRPVVGCFVNPIVVPVDLGDGHHRDDQLAGLTATLRRCFRHSRTPFDELVRSLRPPGTNALWFRTLVVLNDFPALDRTAADAAPLLQPIPVRPPRTASALTVEATPQANGGWTLRGRWRADTVDDRLGHALIEDLAQFLCDAGTPETRAGATTVARALGVPGDA
jgi:hypothetical protein